jgi:hypothetical protein
MATDLLKDLNKQIVVGRQGETHWHEGTPVRYAHNATSVALRNRHTRAGCTVVIAVLAFREWISPNIAR